MPESAIDQLAADLQIDFLLNLWIVSALTTGSFKWGEQALPASATADYKVGSTL